jgi:hypothetical protein
MTGMFPPHQPWKQIATVEPEREYVAFTSRFFLRSPIRVPAFLRQSIRIMKQAKAAPGIVGWSLGSNLMKLEFYTLSAWEDDSSLRTFIRSADHGTASIQLKNDMRAASVFVHFKVLGKDLPLKWTEAVAMQNRRLRERGR